MTEKTSFLQTYGTIRFENTSILQTYGTIRFGT